MECFKKLEARLNGVKFGICKMFELPSSSAIIETQASKMFVLHGTGKMHHMARNIYPVNKVVIEVKLRNFSVELMKITPFNGSNFFNGSKPFLGGSTI
jgi:hypothetical protein